MFGDIAGGRMLKLGNFLHPHYIRLRNGCQWEKSEKKTPVWGSVGGQTSFVITASYNLGWMILMVSISSSNTGMISA